MRFAQKKSRQSLRAGRRADAAMTPHFGNALADAPP
jgi:hypothetical protein